MRYTALGKVLGADIYCIYFHWRCYCAVDTTRARVCVCVRAFLHVDTLFESRIKCLPIKCGTKAIKILSKNISSERASDNTIMRCHVVARIFSLCVCNVYQYSIHTKDETLKKRSNRTMYVCWRLTLTDERAALCARVFAFHQNWQSQVSIDWCCRGSGTSIQSTVTTSDAFQPVSLDTIMHNNSLECRMPHD